MTEQEEMALRELAAKPHYIAKVQDVLGPLSLWSSQGLQDHVRKAVEAEREVNRELVEALKTTRHALSRAGATLRHPAKYVKEALSVADAALNKAQGEQP